MIRTQWRLLLRSSPAPIGTSATGTCSSAASTACGTSIGRGCATAPDCVVVADRELLPVANGGVSHVGQPLSLPRRTPFAPSLVRQEHRTGPMQMQRRWVTRMYGELSSDPTQGRVKLPPLNPKIKPAPGQPPQPRDPNLPPRGSENTKEYDEQYGRWWIERGEAWRPKLFTTIGRHARDPKLHQNMVRWVINTPNYLKLIRDPYRKRWPGREQLCMRFFAEFCLKEFEKKTLLETAHTLPFYGVGCKFWRGKNPDSPDTKGQFFRAESSEYKLRPIRGMMRGTQYRAGRPVRKDITPIAKTLGSWRYEYPKGAHPTVYRPAFPELATKGESSDAA